MRNITVEGIRINFNDLTEKKQMELYLKNRNKYKEEMSKSIYSEMRKMVAIEESESSKFLNQMLIKELNEEQDEDVLEAIFDNEAFEIEEETIKVLAVQDDWAFRQQAAGLSKDSKFLNQMLIKEINEKQDGDVLEAIFDNEAFEMEEETITVLAVEGGWKSREKAAQLSKESKFLNQMLIREVNEEQDGNVLEAILDNQAFEIEEKTMNLLKYSANACGREIVATLLKDSKKLIEMFINEIKRNDMNFDVIESILGNEALILDKKELLEYIRNNC